MKNLFKPLLVLAILAVTFTSCMNNDDNTDFAADRLKEERQIDSLLSKQATLIESYVSSNFANPQQDTLNYPFRYLDKKVKRGFWFEIDSTVTDNSYTYGFDNSGVLRFPKVKLKYTASLLNGEIVRSDIAGSDYLLNISASNSSIVNYVWQISFFPYSIKFNGNDRIIEGLTKSGLKKGNKFKVVTPSIYAFGATSVDKIPANSPIAYEFEVLGIE
ncbi:FKBP-type peptidyl-prolyl cis-trans isomerase [Sphingobacterium paludis]|uniref:peptidylprolyl isomerase n=1 Tax=Sphingobacterium paludis TaxID=1476465 RepID=A0A4R7D6A7_9SPHI|nr:hypothetical protein [Sphingobacterium paludis]TDS15721.1 hypothetical protein B0I21_10234 [Sphingobacterium paludis]